MLGLMFRKFSQVGESLAKMSSRKAIVEGTDSLPSGARAASQESPANVVPFFPPPEVLSGPSCQGIPGA